MSSLKVLKSDTGLHVTGLMSPVTCKPVSDFNTLSEDI